MHVNSIRRSRETWINAITVLSCVLIVAVRLFQSMVKENLIGSTVTYTWFNKTANYFCVPLLFVCAGYLYQQGGSINSVKDWKRNIRKPLIVLGIPYVIFSCLNWLLTTSFSADAGSMINDLVQTLVVRPAAPYGYLYTMILVLLITPTIKNKMWSLVLGGIALGTKGASLLVSKVGIYALDTTLNYWLWFVIGMILAFVKAPNMMRKQKGVRRIGLAVLVLFFVSSVAVVMRNVSSGILNFAFGAFGCCGVVVLAVTTKFTDKSRKIIRWMSDYTMPVFLMHTIFAAGLRSVLLKFGIANAVIHIVLGIAISFAGPVMVGFILKKLKWAEFILYPGKFIKFKSKNKDLSHGK